LGPDSARGFSPGVGSFSLGAWPCPTPHTPTLEQEQEIRTSFVTPHTPWAKPYAGGTTRVLFFSDDMVFPPEMRTSRTTPALRATPPWPRRGKKRSGYHRERFSKNTQAREIVELMQRFEVRADAAYYTRVKVAKTSQMQWHGGEEGIARMRIRERRDDGWVVRDGIPHSPPWLRRGGAERRGGSPIPAEELEVTGPAAAG
jgi:hypothetical protein